jgi:16S rRNA (cytidine1402-2'-O)-methyltransferase
MIPISIVENDPSALGSHAISIIHNTSHFIVERARTARRFIKSTSPPYTIDSLNIYEMDKNNPGIHLAEMSRLLKEGHDVGIMSESGSPGIADPGALYTAEAHKQGYIVSPLSGPSSILLALIGSGLNGQNFAFNGYLPIKDKPLINELRKLEKKVLQGGETQIFIETPYRNDRLVQSMLKHLSPRLKLCIASELTAPHENIRTKAISEWKKEKLELGKQNTVFLLG